MRNAQTIVLSRAVAMASALLLAGAVIVITAGQSMATPAIAAKEKKACAACHTAPPALNDAGKKYKASH
jgi:cytochrome c553